MKQLKWLSVATVLLILAMSFFVYARTTAAAPASSPGTNNPALVSPVTQTVTLQLTGGTTTEKCYAWVQLAQSQAKPGYIQGVAYSKYCTPDAAASCSQTVEIQVEGPGQSTWGTDGDGPTEYGCGSGHASIRTNYCVSSPYISGYRAYAIIFMTTTKGQKFELKGPSPAYYLPLAC
jgi:hypothetical protein